MQSSANAAVLLLPLEAESDCGLMFFESVQDLVHSQVSESDEEPLVDLLLVRSFPNAASVNTWRTGRLKSTGKSSLELTSSG